MQHRLPNKPFSNRQHKTAMLRSTRRARKQRPAWLIMMVGFCVVVTLVVGAVLAVRLGQYAAAQREYEVYAALPEVSPEPIATPAPLFAAAPETSVSATPRPFFSGKVAALQEQNAETVGWLEIPQTNIAYPMVQGPDNSYYMNHTFQKKQNPSGAIFLDCWNAADFSGFNTVIYGHNMKDGSMFAGLRQYEKQNFADQHLRIDITQRNARRRYTVFAAYTVQSEQEFAFRAQSAVTGEERAAFIRAARKRSTFASNLTVSRDDQLLTLVTCTSGSHPWYFVVHAVLAEEVLYGE